jgi:hypothetical protein
LLKLREDLAEEFNLLVLQTNHLLLMANKLVVALVKAFCHFRKVFCCPRKGLLLYPKGLLLPSGRPSVTFERSAVCIAGRYLTKTERDWG